MSQSQGNLWADGRRDPQTVFHRSLSTKTRGTTKLLYRSYVIHFFYFSGTFLASEYLFSAPRGLFILAVLSSLPSIFSALLEDSLFWSYFPRFRVSAQDPRGLFDDAFFFSGTFPASEYLRSALEDSLFWTYFPRYLEYLRS